MSTFTVFSAPEDATQLLLALSSVKPKYFPKCLP